MIVNFIVWKQGSQSGLAKYEMLIDNQIDRFGNYHHKLIFTLKNHEEQSESVRSSTSSLFPEKNLLRYSQFDVNQDIKPVYTIDFVPND